MHLTTGTNTPVAQILCLPAVAANLEWKVTIDLFGSYHYPILIKKAEYSSVEREQAYVIKNAGWIVDTRETAVNSEDILKAEYDVDEMVEVFGRVVISAADAAIPKSSEREQKRRVPWWDTDCDSAVIERERALRRYQRTRSLAGKISSTRARARVKLIQHQTRLASWKMYISAIKDYAPMSHIWAQIKKMKGDDRIYHSPCLVQQGNLETEAY